MRGALHELLHIGHALQRILDHSFVGLRKPSLAAELLDIIPVRGGTRHPASGSMWLLQESAVGQVGHYIANGRWTEPFPAGARNHARPHRLAGGYKRLHDSREDFAFPVADRWAC